jgi:hypothetical protein
MKAKTALHIAIPMQPPEVLRTAMATPHVLRSLDRLPEGGTLTFDRINGQGAVKRCYIPKPAILRVEEL